MCAKNVQQGTNFSNDLSPFLLEVVFSKTLRRVARAFLVFQGAKKNKKTKTCRLSHSSYDLKSTRPSTKALCSNSPSFSLAFFLAFLRSLSSIVAPLLFHVRKSKGHNGLMILLFPSIYVPLSKFPSSSFLLQKFYFLLPCFLGFFDRREFIVTQHPSERTIADFWRMAWEQESRLVVTLSSIDSQECRPFWPAIMGEMLCLETNKRGEQMRLTLLEEIDTFARRAIRLNLEMVISPQLAYRANMIKAY